MYSSRPLRCRNIYEMATAFFSTENKMLFWFITDDENPVLGLNAFYGLWVPQIKMEKYPDFYFPSHIIRHVIAACFRRFF